jgi:hypothetical protein
LTRKLSVSLVRFRAPLIIATADRGRLRRLKQATPGAHARGTDRRSMGTFINGNCGARIDRQAAPP